MDWTEHYRFRELRALQLIKRVVDSPYMMIAANFRYHVYCTLLYCKIFSSQMTGAGIPFSVNRPHLSTTLMDIIIHDTVQVVRRVM